MKNTESANAGIEAYIQNFAQWHYDRNLVDGATDFSQLEKLTEEFTEIYAAIHCEMDADEVTASLIALIKKLHANGRIKAVIPENSAEALMDGVGDFNVVVTNHLERREKRFIDCFAMSWNAIKDRGGKMINGIWVKESDL